MIRKMVIGGLFVVGLTAAPAAAQDSPASVLPSVVETTVQVKGVQLARTGSDIDAEVLAGVGLTAAGLALAVTARQRRQRVAAARS